MDCLLHAWAEPPEEGRFREREALHVQSLSHWAPANIGPYSQALRVSMEVRGIKRVRMSSSVKMAVSSRHVGQSAACLICKKKSVYLSGSARLLFFPAASFESKRDVSAKSFYPPVGV